MNKKIMIVPEIRIVDLCTKDVIATSANGGLNDGDNVGNQKPAGDDEGNIYAPGRAAATVNPVKPEPNSLPH